VSATTEYLQQLGKSQLAISELTIFIGHLNVEPDKSQRQAAFDHLLRVVELTPEQVLQLAESELVREAIGLQLSLRRYATSKDFEAARQAAANEPTWRKVLETLFAGLPTA
jgi:sugar phosphate isomerase/epimerase